MVEEETMESETLLKNVKPEETMESETFPENVKPEETLDMESQIKAAMRARVSHFRQQADSLTFEGVRRLLEKDLGLDTCALDVHKRLVKQLLLESLEGANGDNDLKNSSASGENNVAVDSSEGCQAKKEVKESLSEGEKMEDSPVLGLLTGHKTTKSETEGFKETNNKQTPNESLIKTALKKRAPYIKANSENVTMAGLRRLLEEDLKLDKYALDPFKKFISRHLDEALQSCEVSEPAIGAKKISQKKVDKKVSRRESTDSSDKESDEEEDNVRPRKKSVLKRKVEKSDGIKNRKRTAKDVKVSSKKRVKPAETNKDNSAEDGGNLSENGGSQSSEEKPIKKKEVSTPVYGKRVEHVKSVIKACGMSVPPVIYKKVKQVPESKREAQLIKELEEILSKEGLSSNPSEKEIKEVRKKKERAKELEGIDTSNIVTSSRRRSTTSYVAPPKPKLPIESDSDDGENTDDEDDEEEEEEDNDDGEENDDGDNGKNNSSPSEESNEDDEEADD